MEVHLPHYGAKKKKGGGAGRKNDFHICSEDLCSVLAINVLGFVFVV